MEGESADINIFVIDRSEDGLGPIPFVFKIYPDEANHSRLRYWIELCGGVVLDPGEDDPYAITVLDSLWYVEEKRIQPPKKLPTDIFCSSFIYQSYFRKEVLDLNEYRNSKSLYEDFDANRILTRRMAWNELKRIPHGAEPEPRKQTGSHSSNNNTGGNKEAPRIPPHSEGKSNTLGVKTELIVEGDFSATGSSQQKPKVEQAAVRESADESEDTMGGKSTEEVVENNAHDDDESSPPRRSCEEAQRVPSSSRHTDGVRSKDFLTAEQDRHGPGPAHNRSAAQVVPDETASRATSNSRPRRGALYTPEEGQILLDYVCKHNLHDEFKGIRIWTLMEDKQVLGTRTAQSMKEHFRKIIFSALMSESVEKECPYTCSAGDKQRLKEANGTNHRGMNKKPGRVPQ